MLPYSRDSIKTSYNQEKYYILGEYYYSNSISSYSQILNMKLILSNINILGKPFYEQIKKQKIEIPEDIDNFIQSRLKSFERNRKIDNIM